MFTALMAVLLTACATASEPKQETLNSDELFQRVAKHHQDIWTNIGRANNSALSYEDAAFRINLNHRKEVKRVLNCAKRQDGYEDQAVYQIPPRYEIHVYLKGNAAKKLSNCTHDPLFIAHDVKHGVEDMKAVLMEVETLLHGHNVEVYPEIKTASHSLFERKPYPPSMLSEQAYVKIGVDKENLAIARNILVPLITRHDFLFVTEGQPLDEIFVETSEL